MNLNELKELIETMSSLEGSRMASDDSHWKVGENYFIRTVTHINIGTLAKVTDKELVLKDVSWIGSTARFEQTVKDGELDEVEPFPDNFEVIVGRGALIDAVIWSHPLPREQK